MDDLKSHCTTPLCNLTDDRWDETAVISADELFRDLLLDSWGSWGSWGSGSSSSNTSYIRYIWCCGLNLIISHHGAPKHIWVVMSYSTNRRKKYLMTSLCSIHLNVYSNPSDPLCAPFVGDGIDRINEPHIINL